ncbi:putative quinol monooxygenase [Mycolicibacterium sp. ELW1]|uniref:putative quinol monooxygenase n=1 Tax=Mycobacteriaceae TaxID=1762 RepID=UPI0011F0709D|nr:putative quinol monooxygenase [Mycobacterium sp. ELW1]QEN13114.1 antibiotic biosynthesis monooxygenase [Mycobacterium sp. ELW1]
MESSTAVVVIARWDTTEADLENLLTQIAALGALSLAEPGCLGYEAFQDADEPTSLLLIERYRDEESQVAHVSSPHYQEYVVERIRPLLTSRQVEIKRVRKLV